MMTSGFGILLAISFMAFMGDPCPTKITGIFDTITHFPFPDINFK